MRVGCGRWVVACALTVMALAVAAPGAQAQRWDDDFEDRIDRFSERLEYRLERLGERISRSVERAMADIDFEDLHHQIRVAGLESIRIHDRASHRFGRHEGRRVVVDNRRASRAQEVESWSWEGRVSPGGLFEVQGINGRIRIEPADGEQVEVRAEKHGDRDDPSDVRMEVVEHNRGVTVCAVYPSRSGRRENRCEPGENRQSVQRNDVKVDYEIRVPRGVRVQAINVNGSVLVRVEDGDVEARSVNGDIEVETGGSASASTVNGSVRARFGRLDAEDRADFSTVNGGITLIVPADLDADIDASWLNGSLDTDLPLTLHGRFGRRRAEGRLGDGGARIDLETVNGSIEIREW